MKHFNIFSRVAILLHPDRPDTLNSIFEPYVQVTCYPWQFKMKDSLHTYLNNKYWQDLDQFDTSVQSGLMREIENEAV